MVLDAWNSAGGSCKTILGKCDRTTFGLFDRRFEKKKKKNYVEDSVNGLHCPEDVWSRLDKIVPVKADIHSDAIP